MVKNSVIVEDYNDQLKNNEQSTSEIPNTNLPEGSLTVTGSLGDIMKESVEIAYSFAKHYVY